MEEKIRLTIDGNTVDVERGATILDAARTNQVGDGKIFVSIVARV